MHHLISDAWSMGLLSNQILNEYNKLLNLPNTTESINYSYLDYIRKEEEYFNSDKFVKDKEFWNTYLSDMPEHTYFIPTNKHSSQNDLSALRKGFSLSHDLTTSILDFCKSIKISPFTLFMGALSIYLSKANNQDSIVIGTPILNRSNFKEKNMTGLFISTIPFKIDITNIQVLDFFIELSQNLKTLFRHQKYPITTLLNDLKEKNPSLTKFYNLILSYQNTRDNSKSSSTPYHVDWVFNKEITEDINIHIYDFDDTGELQIFYDYQTSIYKENDICNIHSRLLHIISQIMNDLSLNIQNIDILTNTEKDNIINLNEANTSIYPFEKTLSQVFYEQVNFNPDKVALKYKNSNITYDLLNKKSNQLARKLIDSGLKKNNKVIILTEKNTETYILILAIIKAGAIFVPIDTEAPKDRINLILDDCEPTLIFADTDFKKLIHHKHINKTIYILMEALDEYDDANLENLNLPTDPAYIMYTSGSTGTPKGVIVSHQNIIRLVKNTNYINFNSSDVILQSSTLAFDASTFEIWGALLNNLTLCILNKSDLLNINYFKNYISENKVSIVWLTVAIFNKFADFDPSIFSCLRVLLTGGDALLPRTINLVRDACPNLSIINGYGPTENTTFSCCFSINEKYTDSIPIGKPISNSTCYILNKFGTLQPPYVPGELYVGGSGVSLGYLNNTELTNNSFLPDFANPENKMYKTGDLVYLDNNNNINFLGRIDNQVKIRGFRIELSEIESALKSHIAINDVTVNVLNINENKFICAYLILDRPVFPEELTIYLKTLLPTYMIPSQYVFLDSFPITANGKIDKRKLISQTPTIQMETKRVILPKTILQKELYNIFTTTLKKDNISLDDDFFNDLNLDSLDIMTLSTKLTSYNLKIQDLNNFSSIEKLDNLISNSQKNISSTSQLTTYTGTSLPKNLFKFDLSHILVTGVTGFLGSHVMYELLENKDVKKIYCLIRSNKSMTSEERFNETYNLYFKDNLLNLAKEKIIVLDGDITENNLGLHTNSYHDLLNNVTTVIHSAALVKHYGNYDEFDNVNVNGTKRIIQFCQDSLHAKLAHISTLSVGGFSKLDSLSILKEDLLISNPSFNNNVYMISKYNAEIEILNSINNGLLDAKIFRLGNIMPRESDGQFQKNIFENAFICRLNTLLKFKYISNSLKTYSIDISPVDQCSKTIVKLLDSYNDNCIFHISNNNKVTLEYLLRDFMSDFKIICNEDLECFINTLSLEPLDALLLEVLSNNEYFETPVDNRLTINQLNKLGFKWNAIDTTYINNLIKLLPLK